ncbi:MAG: ribonuclease HIII [Deltaproteobacteria bacterium]|nr:MAG: ribonuclease HIII [Deltaproteobacteria bacterium]
MTGSATDRAGTWIGSDESGKGDYFGPLVVAAVAVDEASAERLAAAGVQDSKRVSNRRAQALSDLILAECPHALVVIGPRKYNELYERIGNLNRLLAWAHARAIEDLLDDVEPTVIVVDKFADDRVLRQALMKKGARHRVIQVVRGESDPAVAAASILARARFLSALEELSRTWNVPLAAGAGTPTLEAGRAFVARHGAPALREVAKLHFKTTAAVTSALNSDQRRSR